REEPSEVGRDTHRSRCGWECSRGRSFLVLREGSCRARAVGSSCDGATSSPPHLHVSLVNFLSKMQRCSLRIDSPHWPVWANGASITTLTLSGISSGNTG